MAFYDHRRVDWPRSGASGIVVPMPEWMSIALFVATGAALLLWVVPLLMPLAGWQPISIDVFPGAPGEMPPEFREHAARLRELGFEPLGTKRTRVWFGVGGWWRDLQEHVFGGGDCVVSLYTLVPGERPRMCVSSLLDGRLAIETAAQEVQIRTDGPTYRREGVPTHDVAALVASHRERLAEACAGGATLEPRHDLATRARIARIECDSQRGQLHGVTVMMCELLGLTIVAAEVVAVIVGGLAPDVLAGALLAALVGCRSLLWWGARSSKAARSGPS